MTETGINPKQQRAITALLDPAHRTDGQVAASTSERTLACWMADPTFRAALRTAEGDLLDATGRRLLGMQDSAIDTIDALLTASGDAIRLCAATEVLDRLLAWRELTAIEDRLAALETLMANETT